MKIKKKLINKKNFEKSIEFIYAEENLNKESLPLILYIGGTGWLGYFPIIYKIADICNKRILYKLVNEGYSCAIVRYRGKFFKPLSIRNNIILLLITINIDYYIGLFLLIFIIYWIYSSNYFPKINEMKEDLIKNINKCLFYNNNLIKYEMNTNGEIIVIAYSAGSHLLLSSFKKLDIKNINLIKKIILISGVLNIPKKEDLKDGIIDKMTKLVLDLINNNKKECLNILDEKIVLYEKIPFLIVKSKYEFFNIPIIEKVAKKFLDKTNFIKNINDVETFYVESNHWLILTNKKVLEKIKNFINK